MTDQRTEELMSCLRFIDLQHLSSSRVQIEDVLLQIQGNISLHQDRKDGFFFQDSLMLKIQLLLNICSKRS